MLPVRSYILSRGYELINLKEEEAMNIIVRISSCLCLLILFTALCVAQEKVEIPINPPPPPMQPLPVIKEVGKAKVLYNERGNKTLTLTSPLQVQGEWRNGIRLQARF